MNAPQVCDECHAIERELEEAGRLVSSALTSDVNLNGRLRDREARLREFAGESGEAVAPSIPPEIKDWARWSHLVCANESVALVRLRQAIARKFSHEWLTGHTIRFPYAA